MITNHKNEERNEWREFSKKISDLNFQPYMENFLPWIFFLRISERKSAAHVILDCMYTERGRENFLLLFCPLLCVSLLFVLGEKWEANVGKSSIHRRRERNEKKYRKAQLWLRWRKERETVGFFWLCRQMISNKSCFVLKSLFAPFLLRNHKAILNDFLTLAHLSDDQWMKFLRDEGIFNVFICSYIFLNLFWKI